MILKKWRNQKSEKDHLDHSIIEICKNTQKSPEDLSRLAVTQSPVVDY